MHILQREERTEVSHKVWKICETCVLYGRQHIRHSRGRMWMDAGKEKARHDEKGSLGAMLLGRVLWNKKGEKEKKKIEDKKTAVFKSNNKNEARETGMSPRVSKQARHTQVRQRQCGGYGSSTGKAERELKQGDNLGPKEKKKTCGIWALSGAGK